MKTTTYFLSLLLIMSSVVAPVHAGGFSDAVASVGFLWSQTKVTRVYAVVAMTWLLWKWYNKRCKVFEVKQKQSKSPKSISKKPKSILKKQKISSHSNPMKTVTFSSADDPAEDRQKRLEAAVFQACNELRANPTNEKRRRRVIELSQDIDQRKHCYPTQSEKLLRDLEEACRLCQN